MPTPTASDGNGAGGHGTGGPDLRTEIRTLPTPTASDYKGSTVGRREPGAHRSQLGAFVEGGALLPTPVVNDMGEGKTVERWDEWTDDLKTRHRNGNGHGPSLAIEAQRLEVADDGGLIFDVAETIIAGTLPTLKEGYGGRHGNFHGLLTGEVSWGKYAAAIHRWEALTRPAPPPTEPNRNGSPRLSARFVEWMMGLDEGHVTDTPDLPRPAQLKALGNGVVPQQAAEAFRRILTRNPAAAAALL